MSVDQDLLQRIEHLFQARFQKTPTLVASPGRINLIGDHTDYNSGLVFPAAIDRHIVLAIAPSNSSTCSVHAADFDETREFDLNNIQKAPTGHWINYILGVVHGLRTRGANIEGFDMVFGSNLPIGAGLSSSAALENGVGLALNHLFDLEINKRDLVRISVKAEHDFAGVQCGMMDQFANLFGQEDHALLLDCATEQHEAVPVKLGDHSLVLINSNVKHQLSDSPYNERKQQCIDGLSILKEHHPELAHLSEASLEQIEASREQMPQVVYNRCQFVAEENQRVREAREALNSKNLTRLGALLNASHAGLRNLYEVSCSEVDFLVEAAVGLNPVLGSRMMGGGFGGCTINLVHSTYVDEFAAHMLATYQSETGITADYLKVNLSKGTHIVES